MPVAGLTAARHPLGLNFNTTLPHDFMTTSTTLLHARSNYTAQLAHSINTFKGHLRQAKTLRRHAELMEDIANLQQEYVFATA
jgi:hypothetical protein